MPFLYRISEIKSDTALFLTSDIATSDEFISYLKSRAQRSYRTDKEIRDYLDKYILYLLQTVGIDIDFKIAKIIDEVEPREVSVIRGFEKSPMSYLIRIKDSENYLKSIKRSLN